MLLCCDIIWWPYEAGITILILLKMKLKFFEDVMQLAKVCDSGKNSATSHYCPWVGVYMCVCLCVCVLYIHVCVYDQGGIAEAEASKQLKTKQG